MKNLFFLIPTLVALGLTSAFAQLGPHAGGPHFGGAMDKLFGTNQAFSAVMEVQTAGRGGNPTTMPGKFSFAGGKTRFEMNMSELRGAQMPPGAAEHMKAMGMDTIISISRPDLKLMYLVYPGLNSYAAMTPPDAAASAAPDDFKVETEKLGSETVDGHDCVKNKVTVTDKDGNQHVSTVWNATDLKNFPLKIVTAGPDGDATILFKNISFDKPAAGDFEPPSGFTKYDSVQTMMQTEMMKKMGGGAGMPPR